MLLTPSEQCLQRGHRYGFPILLVGLGCEVRAYYGRLSWEAFVKESKTDVEYASKQLIPGASVVAFRRRS